MEFLFPKLNHISSVMCGANGDRSCRNFSYTSREIKFHIFYIKTYFFYCFFDFKFRIFFILFYFVLEIIYPLQKPPRSNQGLFTPSNSLVKWPHEHFVKSECISAVPFHNIIRIYDIVKRYGADTLRLYEMFM